VWCPQSDFSGFVLVDDEGVLLNRGTATQNLPPLRERQGTYQGVEGSKYARACALVTETEEAPAVAAATAEPSGTEEAKVDQGQHCSEEDRQSGSCGGSDRGEL
jgi:hypothetical protein